ncbi:putative ubiquitin conjugating enzyme 7 interacting protein 3 isoform 2 [Operophtera brumata]|uniref:Putative ubiquitin conjugating enzyme 7 interacting protein 3 isoform 2 n=1 Tax=Operophtera brumata TaxID=104452 RepID=A0A0L7LHK8_OPEBR|nr:putative ubiquitin conjugating enzyme 7 interacting protein 3 isoform 2 [Operophtera brumata]
MNDACCFRGNVMSAVDVEVARPRPLSGGLWTLFSWLRRDDRSSSESLSSVGSDRTAASFAFLGPGHYSAASPLVIPPPGPPTDSYKKRVRDRNLRRQHDRDITLLRKYGLHGFDGFSLPNARRVAGERSERDRRATSELFQRRAHVPGKRRAPLPPSASLTRPRARKRPAPQPPLPIVSVPEEVEEDKYNVQLNNSETLPMNSERVPDKQSMKHNDVTMGCKSEKYSKKESSTKDVKPRDKSFLKQIFETRKRNSAIETSSVKLLPSISELDKQAHEIIERYKLKEFDHNVSRDGRVDELPGSSKPVEAWICTRCLKKYNATVITCLYCLPLEHALLNNSCKASKVTNNFTQTNNSQRNALEDKEKLKEILKEMKDSLPKKSTAGPTDLKNKNPNDIETKADGSRIVEATTLRIGSSVYKEEKNTYTEQPSSPTCKIKSDSQPNSGNTKDKSLATIENVLVTQPMVLVHTKDNIVNVNKNNACKHEEKDKPNSSNNMVTRKVASSNVTKTEIASKLLNANKTPSKDSSNPESDLDTPLKISSLLNPIYIPRSTKTNAALTTSTKELKQTQQDVSIPVLGTKTNNNSALLSTPQCKSSTSDVLLPMDNKKLDSKKEERKQQSAPNESIVIVKKIVETKTPIAQIDKSSTATSQGTAPEVGIVEKLDQHSRRRNLINQLEQSIAKGDERAAAEAAVKLAQLRLSCSVLSFSSQIVAEGSTIEKSSSKVIGKTDERNSKETQNIDRAKTENVTLATATKESKAKNLTDNSNIIKPNASNNTAAEHQDNQSKATFVTAPVAAKPKSESPLKKDVAVQNPMRYLPSTSKETNNAKKDNNEDVPTFVSAVFRILVWVEDKEATRGPVQIHVQRNATMGDLRRQAEKSLGLAVRMQRWIIGRALCSEDNTTLVTLAGPDELVKLERQALVSNAEVFECGVCMEECAPGKGVVLRECVHSFCNECLSDVVRHSEEPVVSCPAMGCRGVLQEREIKGLVSPEEYEKWLARGLAVAESGTRNAFHCRTRDCTGWALCEPGVRRFPCPAIHEGDTCEQHSAKLQATAAANEATNQTDEGTRALLDSLIARGEALECPECSAIITKKWGCDWIKCSACKTEICWVTRGRRWGAAGRGDTSGGCRCGLDGKKCHPSCGYCH